LESSKITNFRIVYFTAHPSASALETLLNTFSLRYIFLYEQEIRKKYFVPEAAKKLSFVTVDAKGVVHHLCFLILRRCFFPRAMAREAIFEP